MLTGVAKARGLEPAIRGGNVEDVNAFGLEALDLEGIEDLIDVVGVLEDRLATEGVEANLNADAKGSLGKDAAVAKKEGTAGAKTLHVAWAEDEAEVARVLGAVGRARY